MTLDLAEVQTQVALATYKAYWSRRPYTQLGSGLSRNGALTWYYNPLTIG